MCVLAREVQSGATLVGDLVGIGVLVEEKLDHARAIPLGRQDQRGGSVWVALVDVYRPSREKLPDALQRSDPAAAATCS